jgi:hypothetical protein
MNIRCSGIDEIENCKEIQKYEDGDALTPLPIQFCKSLIDKINITL